MKFWNTNQNNWTDYIPTEFETESEALLFAKNLTNFEIIKMYVNEQ